MKSIKVSLSLLFCLIASATFAQNNEKTPLTLFSSFPATIEISANILENTINANPGNDITLGLSKEFQFSGKVLSNEKVYSNLQTIKIRSAAFNNSIFQLSKIQNDDKSYSYVGRIIHPGATDGYRINKDEKGNYSLEKFEMNSILQDCSHN